MVQSPPRKAGITYAPGITGKGAFRIRERYIAESVAPMIRARRIGAVKLDLILRGLALLPAHAGQREPGHLLRYEGRLGYQALHDLCRDHARFAMQAPHDFEDDRDTLEKKRIWVREQLLELERRFLVERRSDPLGRRPDIVVLRDLADGKPYDDPTGKDGGYITVHGSVISSSNFRGWGAAEVVAYLCAMTADRFARNRCRERKVEIPAEGSATWFRQADWFNNENKLVKRPEGHVAYPFSTMTIQRGLRKLRDEGLIKARRTIINPENGQRFKTGPRMVYENRFTTINQTG